MRSARRLWGCRASVVVLASVAVACGGAEARRDDAVAVFSRWYSCPKESVTAAPREAVPPGDVASDPDRLAVWNTQHAGGTSFTVEGCGQSKAFVCNGGGACRTDAR